MKLLIVPVLFVVAATNETIAQTRTTRESHITINTSYKRLTDGFILSYPVTGGTVGAEYNFSKTTAAKKLDVSFNVATGSLSNNLTEVKTHAVELRLSQGFSLLRSGNGRLNSYWGYSLSANPSFIRASDKEDSRKSWASFNDLSLYHSLMYDYGAGKITWDVIVPVIGLSSRPLEKDSWHNTTTGLLYDSYSNLFFTSWKNRQSVSSDLNFKKQLGTRLNVVIGAQFNYNKVKQDDYYKEVQAGFYAGISILLR